jgi:uncharacterized iron-regulated membrane protein
MGARHLTRQLVRQIHLWIGLLLCVPLVLIGLSGSVLVFQDELRGLFAQCAQPGAPHAVGEIISAGRRAAPDGMVPSSYAAPPVPGRLATVRLSPSGHALGPGDTLRIDIDPVTLAPTVNPAEVFLRQVFFLHSTLLLKNREGRQIAGWFGIAMLAMGLTGLVNWWPRRGNWPGAFSVSWTAQGYRLWRELHGVTGIWGFGVLALVSFTALYLAFPETIRVMVDALLPARDLRAEMAAAKVQPVEGVTPLDVDDAIALAEAAVPEGEPSLVFFPARPEQPFRIALLRDRQDRHATPITVLVDPWARRVVETFDPRRFSAGETLLAAQHALHSGERFGSIWKLLVFACGFAPLFFAATGLAMWLKRRRHIAEVISLVDESQMVRRAGE